MTPTGYTPAMLRRHPALRPTARRVETVAAVAAVCAVVGLAVIVIAQLI